MMTQIYSTVCIYKTVSNQLFTYLQNTKVSIMSIKKQLWM